MWEFKTSLEWKQGEAADLLCDKKPTLDITPPPEFGGKADRWSPEDLLVGAVESCMLLTALYFVDKMKIGMTSYRSRSSGAMERTPNGLRFTGITVLIEAAVASSEDEAKMRKAVEQAEKFCPVSAAVNVPVTLELTTSISAASGA